MDMLAMSRGMRPGTYIDMCTEMFIDMCTDMCVDMCVDLCEDSSLSSFFLRTSTDICARLLFPVLERGVSQHNLGRSLSFWVQHLCTSEDNWHDCQVNDVMRRDPKSSRLVVAS